MDARGIFQQMTEYARRSEGVFWTDFWADGGSSYEQAAAAAPSFLSAKLSLAGLTADWGQTENATRLFGEVLDLLQKSDGITTVGRLKRSAVRFDLVTTHTTPQEFRDKFSLPAFRVECTKRLRTMRQRSASITPD